MRVADTYLGRRESGAVAARLAREGFETVTVDGDQRRRSRFRTVTDAGTELGVTVNRELTGGDVLAAGDGDLLVVVELESVEAMVVDLSGAAGSLTGAAALGHATGNRHWTMAVQGEELLFPATESRERMEATVADLLPGEASVEFRAVSPAVFDDGTADHGHSHGHDHDHDHGHRRDHGGGSA